MNRDAFGSVRKDLLDLCESTATPRDFIRSVGAALSRAVPRDLWAMHAVDPATLIPRCGGYGGSVDELTSDAEACREIARQEFLAPSVNAFADLARSSPTASALHVAAESAPPGHRFSHYRRVGITDELRATFVSGGACWGVSTFCRQGGTPFTAAEVRFVAGLSPLIGAALRRIVWREASVKVPVFPPVIVVLDDRDRIEEISAGAERWLEQLKVLGPEMERQLPVLMSIVAEQARRRWLKPLPGGDFRRVRTLTDGWVSIRGSRLKGRRRITERIAVIVEPANQNEIAEFLLTSYQLSTRERQIALRLSQGEGPQEIARHLQLSPYTVRDHLKKVFEKLNVHSTAELIAKLFVGVRLDLAS
jgi:DNA-binding CsgD family transcriptional regulator